jgi:TonB-dependent starch-binding outer membrane protein SusC
MKKLWMLFGFPRESLSKLVLKMKLLAFLMFAVLAVSAADSYSQEAKFSLKLKDATVREVFDHIEDNSEFILLYNEKWVNVNRRVDIHVKNETVEKILDQVFKGTRNVYKIYDRQVVILQDEKAEIPANVHRGIAEIQIQQPQQKEIAGKVTDTDGLPLPGVSVVVKGTTIGTVTNNDGEFSLNIPLDAETLQFSFVGMKTQEVPVGDRTTISVSMEQESIGLEEVVAVGYGTMKKSDLTGSVSQVVADKFKEQSIYSPENVLAGRLAGVKVIDGAQPGAGGSILIRGSNSMLGGTEPLYVIDGVPVEPNEDARGQSVGGSSESSINFLDPSSIERIDVLKDASSTAIYGARGANGVVLITTKQGQEGRSELSFKYSMSISEITRKKDILNGPEFAEWMNLGSSNLAWLSKSWWNYQMQQFESGQISELPQATPWNVEYESENYTNPQWIFDGIERPLPNSQDLPNTDWQNAVMRQAVTNNYSVNYSGGSPTGTFSFGINYLDQEGIIIGSNFERFNSNFNTKQNLNEKVIITSRVNLTKGNTNAVMTNNGHIVQNIISKVTTFAPTNPILGEGETFEDFDFNDPNYLDSPIDIATKLIDDKQQLNLLASFGIDYKIIKDLTLSTLGAITYNANTRDTYWPMSTARGMASRGDATSADNEFFKYLNQFQFTYNKKLNGNHNLNITGVHTNEKIKRRNDFMHVKNFPTDALDYKNLASGIDYTVPQNSFIETFLKSYLGRINYNFKNRYLLTLSFRADGSSLFAKNNKWGYFPSGAFAWRISEEPFFKNVQVFSNLKYRLSFGSTGGQAISPYQSLATLSTKNYTFNGNIVSGFIENNLENPDLKWETTDQYNMGIDLGFLKNRLNITLDAYYKKTNDLLMIVDNPPSSGFSSRIQNAGSVENKGIEAEIFAQILDKDFKWSATANFSMNRNKVLSMGDYEFQFSTYTINGYRPIIFKEGEPIGAFYGFEKVKIFEAWEEIKNSAQPGAYVGDMMYKDQNNDKILNSDDMVIIGNYNPDALWGITNDFQYKNFDLSILVDGQIGGDIYSIENMNLESNFRTQATIDAAKNSWVTNEELPGGTWELSDGTQFSSEGYNYMFGNSDPYEARPMFNRISNDRTRVSDEYIQDATFIKLRNISLGYNLQSDKLRTARIKNVRLFISATNLFIITKFNGYDPEVTAFTNNPSRRGLDFGTYPLSRTFTFGVNATF